MIRIKILFAGRPDLFSLLAGDSYQIKSLAKALKDLGVDVKITTELREDLQGFDLVHCFNMLRANSCLRQCKWFKKNNIFTILTPIYWDLSEYLRYYSPERLNFWYSEEKKRQEILKLVDYLAPNAENEFLLMKRNFNFELSYSYVYNGVEEEFLSKKEFFSKKYILSVGRIHPRKNQLNMIKAVKGLNKPVLFIGRINDRNYLRRCKEEADQNINFLEEIPRPQLKDYYNKTRVHLMVSWYDTPGLVNLEAGLAGSNLLLTDRGTTQDYFQNFAYYSSPLDINDIRKKINTAYSIPPENELQKIILEKYTWNKIALKLKKTYENIIN